MGGGPGTRGPCPPPLLFAYDGTLGVWEDLSAALPGGVVTEHEGIIALNLLAEEHLLVGLAHPSSDIVLYDYRAEQPVRIVPTIPWKLGNPLSREVIVAPSGNIYIYRGTEEVEQRSETHSVWVYSIHTGELRDTGFQMTNGFWIGQTQRRDGSKIYLNTTGGELYEFDVATETFNDLGYACQPATSGLSTTPTPSRSPDTSSFDWAFIPRGVAVDVLRQQEGFVHVCFVEGDVFPDPAYITYQITGWVREGCRATQQHRCIYHLTCQEETPDTWRLYMDQHHYTLVWVDIEDMPEIVAPQNTYWAKFRHQIIIN